MAPAGIPSGAGVPLKLPLLTAWANTQLFETLEHQLL